MMTCDKKDIVDELMSALESERRSLSEERARISEELEQLEALRKNIQTIVNPLPEDSFVLKLSINGQLFEVQSRTLRSNPTSLLAGICTQVAAKPNPQAEMPVYIDRNPGLFPLILEFYRNGTVHLDDLTRGQLHEFRSEAEFFFLPTLLPIIDAALCTLDSRAADASHTIQSLARVADYISDKGLLPIVAATLQSKSKNTQSKSSAVPSTKPTAPVAVPTPATTTTTTTTTTPQTSTTAAGGMSKTQPQRIWWEAVGKDDGASGAVVGQSVMSVGDGYEGELYVSPVCTFHSGDRTLVIDLEFAKGIASIGVVTTEYVKKLKKMYVGDRISLRKQRVRLGMENDTWGLDVTGEFWTEATPYSTGLAPFKPGTHNKVSIRIDLDLGMIAFTRDNYTWSATIPRWAELCLAVVGSRGCTYTIVPK